MNGAHVLGLPRAEAGYLLLEMLGLDGWEISIISAPIGVQVKASGWGHDVDVDGPSVPDVSLLVFETCRRLRKATAACPA